MAKLWDTIRGWVDENATSYIYTRIPQERTDAADQDAPLVPQASYLRLWLCELYLGKSRAWGKAWFPAVHAEVRLKFADRNEATFSRVIRPPDGQHAHGVYLNNRLTELLPYNGGVVEVEAALLALPGADYLGTVISVLQQFSALVVPPLGPALAVATKVSESTRDLLSATQGGIHLGFHEAFVAEGGGGGNVLRPGYLAVVLATPSQVDPDRLWVADDRLRYAKERTQPVPLEGYDYLLFRVEGRSERDDWRLKDIDDPLQESILAMSQGEEERAKAYRTVALAAAWQSPDLAARDRRRVVAAIKEELAAVEREGFGAVGDAARTLGDIVTSRRIPLTQAAALGELTADEVFGD
jgi:hypothetical protein